MNRKELPQAAESAPKTSHRLRASPRGSETRDRPLYLTERYLPSAAAGPVPMRPAELGRESGIA